MTPDQTKATTLLGRTITATLESGQSEDVVVRQYRMREQERVLASIPNWKALVEIACDRPSGWADLLTFDSFRALRVATEEVNAGFFDVCAENLRLEMRLLGPEISGNLMERFASGKTHGRPAGN